MNASEFVSGLEGVKRSGKGYVARCPAHDDRRQSLSVSTGDDGRVLLHCHAGCKAADVAEAVGVGVSDLFAEKPKQVGPEAVYEYTDERGRMLFQVVRFPGKNFRQRKPDGRGGWDWKLGDVRRVLYRLPAIVDASPDIPVHVCEGEKDADLLAARGFLATTNAGGSSNWRREYAESLRGRDVVVLPDNDDAGRKHANAIAESLREVSLRTRVVELPGLSEKGDVSDWFGAGGTEDKLREIIADTGEWGAEDESPIDIGFRSSADRLDGEIAERKDLASRVLKFNVSYLDDVFRGILPHDLILIGARTGAGKTALASMIAKLNASSGKRVHYFALEAEPKEIERRLKYMFIAYAAREKKLPRRYELNYTDWYLGRCDDIVGDIEAKAESAVRKNFATLHTYYRGSKFDVDDISKMFLAIQDQTDLIILDHLHYVDSDDPNENRGFKEIVKRIRDAALRIGKPVICIAHLRKKERKGAIIPDLEEFHGSSDITKIATKAILLAPAYDIANPSPEIANTYMFAAKDRMSGATRYAAVIGFDRTTAIYENSYQIGRIVKSGEEFEPLSPTERRPSWAKGATNGH